MTLLCAKTQSVVRSLSPVAPESSSDGLMD
jgi:hypothetical protein